MKQLEIRLWLIRKPVLWPRKIWDHACSADTIHKGRHEGKQFLDMHHGSLLMTKRLVMVVITPRRQRRQPHQEPGFKEI